jgi:hypothetical protein
MSSEAKELRELVRQIEKLVGESRIASIAAPAVNALCEYLTLRAHVMELTAERDFDNRHIVRGSAKGQDA